jgi:hypothetical protein
MTVTASRIAPRISHSVIARLLQFLGERQQRRTHTKVLADLRNLDAHMLTDIGFAGFHAQTGRDQERTLVCRLAAGE